MKIAMVFDGLGFGGIERVGIDYIKILLQLGHKVDIYNLNPTYEDMKKEIPPDVTYYSKKFSLRLCPELYSYGVKKWWWGKFAYPILHTFTTWLLPFRKFFAKKRKYDLAIAFAGHFRDLTFVAHNFIKADKKLCWLHGCLTEYMLIADGYLSLYRKIKNLSVLSTLFNSNVLSSNKFLKTLNIRKIYNPTMISDRPVDENQVRRLKDEYGDFFLMIGRMTDQKDYKTVIDAFRIFKDRGYSHKILFVGDGENREFLETYAKENMLEKDCIFMGSRSDVQNFYKACYGYVHSSPLEGLPTVIIEAMSFGVPIAATNSLPGVEEIIQGGKYGLLSAVGDSEALAANLMLLAHDKNLYRDLQQKSRDRSKIFSPVPCKKELEKILKELI